MKKKNINVEKMIEIESYSKDILPLTDNIEELKYWIYSIKMPLIEIKKDLDIYDKSFPKLDELKFIDNLQIKYNQSKENVILRIKQVRTIIKYEKENKKSNKIKSKKLNSK